MSEEAAEVESLPTKKKVQKKSTPSKEVLDLQERVEKLESMLIEHMSMTGGGNILLQYGLERRKPKKKAG